MKVIVAVLATAAVLTGAAFAGRASTAPDQAALAKRVAALDARVKRLERAQTAPLPYRFVSDVLSLENYVGACLGNFVGVSQYDVTIPLNPDYTFTALDEDASAPSHWLVEASSACKRTP